MEVQGSIYNVIRGLIREHGAKFMVNCSESLITVKKDCVVFKPYVTGDVHWITPETSISFDKKNNEFVWFEDDFELRAKPYLELDRELAEALSEYHAVMKEVEADLEESKRLEEERQKAIEDKKEAKRNNFLDSF